MKLRIAAALCLLASGAIAMPAESGGVLVGENGMTLYTFTKDAAGKSNCNDDCAANWPPYFADEADEGTASGAFSVIERDDGTYQWAANGMPLYFWVNDQNPGDKTGDGVGGVWNVARP